MSAGGSDLTWQTQRVDGGTIFVQSGGSRPAIPRRRPAAGHARGRALQPHGAAARAQRAGEGRAEHRGRSSARRRQPGTASTSSARFPGTDKADEIVLIGAHFDSWHGATGATDNATGSAAMMEVLRIIKATGLKPRRTIRIGLWGAEEGGPRSARAAYAREHLGTREAARSPSCAKTTRRTSISTTAPGKIRGIWMQGNTAVKPIFEAWIKPLKDLGVEILGPRSVAPDRSHQLRRARRAGVPVRAGALRVQLAHAPLEHGLPRSRAGRGHEADRDRRGRLRLAGGDAGSAAAEKEVSPGSGVPRFLGSRVPVRTRNPNRGTPGTP